MKGRDNYEYMTAGSVPRTICELAVPTIISMLVTAIYNVADTYFVGRIDTQSTAAIGISFSAMSVVQAFGFFFGHGSGNYISRMLGARKTGHAETMATIGLFSSFAAGTVIAITGIIFLGPLCMALGSTETILPYAKEYLGIILIGTPFMAASLTLNNQIRFKGNAKYAMVGIISGALINIIMDPILIFGFDMGVRGAAIATISGQIIGFAALLFIDRRTGTFSVSFRAFKPTVRAYIEIIKGGLPSLLRQGLLSISTILLNVAAKEYGDSAIAGMAITTRIIYILNAIVIGLGQGYQPVCGFNYGAKLYGRVCEGFWFCVKAGTLFFLTCSVLGYIFAPEAVAIFRRRHGNRNRSGGTQVAAHSFAVRSLYPCEQHDAPDNQESRKGCTSRICPSGALFYSVYSDTASSDRDKGCGNDTGNSRHPLVPSCPAAHTRHA